MKSIWNVETLRLYFEQRFIAQESAVNAALAAADRAVQKAETASERRFEGVNEFRGALADQQREWIRRSEVDVMVTALENKVSKNEQQIDRLLAERMGLKGGWGYAVGVMGFVSLLIALFRSGLVKP